MRGVRLQILSFNMLRRKIFGEANSDNNKRLKLLNESSEASIENENSGESSKYFSNHLSGATVTVNVAEKILDSQKRLSEKLNTLNFISNQIKYVYKPLEYASEPNENFIQKYCTTLKKLLFVGINPGPNGMCQTGVPFGDPKWVTNWLKVQGHVHKPSIECPERPIYGLSCPKGEPSGDRLWNFFSRICVTPDNFFKHSFVFNFCPVAFMDDKARNVTPDEFVDSKARTDLEQICNDWYLEVIEILKPEIVIAIGKYTEKKTKDLFKARNVENISVLYMPHPSPRAPGDWYKKAENFLANNNLEQYFANKP